MNLKVRILENQKKFLSIHAKSFLLLSQIYRFKSLNLNINFLLYFFYKNLFHQIFYNPPQLTPFASITIPEKHNNVRIRLKRNGNGNFLPCHTSHKYLVMSVDDVCFAFFAFWILSGRAHYQANKRQHIFCASFAACETKIYFLPPHRDD